MPQRMRRHALLDSRGPRRGVDGAAELAGRHWIDRVLTRKQPSLRPRRPPPLAQQFEQLGREHDVPISLSLALLNPQRHALAIDVGHFQGHDLGHAQARPVGDAERGPVLDAGRRFEKARHLLLAQHDRRLARLLHGRQRADEVRPFERHLEEEPQRGDGGVDARRANPVLGQV